MSEDRSQLAYTVVSGSVGPYEAGESFRAIELTEAEAARRLADGQIVVANAEESAELQEGPEPQPVASAPEEPIE